MTKDIKYTFLMQNDHYSPTRAMIAALLTGKRAKINWPYGCSYEDFTNVPWIQDLDDSKIGGKVREGLSRLDAGESLDIPSDISYNSFELSHELSEKSFLCVVVQDDKQEVLGAGLAECMINHLPFILVADTGALKTLHGQGYKTFSCWWPEEYGHVHDPLTRMEMLFDIIREINTWTLDRQSQILEEMADVLEHNHKNITQKVNHNE